MSDLWVCYSGCFPWISTQKHGHMAGKHGRMAGTPRMILVFKFRHVAPVLRHSLEKAKWNTSQMKINQWDQENNFLCDLSQNKNLGFHLLHKGIRGPSRLSSWYYSFFDQKKYLFPSMLGEGCRCLNAGLRASGASASLCRGNNY